MAKSTARSGPASGAASGAALRASSAAASGATLRRTVRAAGCALLAGTLAAACGSGGGSSSSGPSDALAIGLIAEPASLDFTTTDGAAVPQATLGSIYEGLVRVDQQGKIQPLLAERYERSDDGRTYTFHLRKGVKFTSGAEFTADDAVFSIERVKKDWKLKTARQMDVVGKAEKTGDHTVKVTLNHASNGWLYAMTTRIGAMFSRTGVADLAAHPVGTGPFKLAERRRGDRIVLDRNDSYWGSKPELGKVTLKYFKDAGAMNNALLTKGIDVVGTVQAPESLSRFSDKSRFRTIEGSSTGEVVLSMNNSREPFKDKRVRQAVRHAIDHKALVETSRAGHGKLIGTMAVPTDPWYEDLTGGYPYDPAKAKQLLKDAGAEGRTVKFRVPNMPYAMSAAQVVKSQLDQVGLKAEIEPLEFPARWLSEVYNKADYDLSVIAHTEPRDLWTFADPGYYFRYGNPAYAKLLKDADSGRPEDEAARYREAARLLSDDAAADWLYLMPNLMVADKDVTGLPVNQVGEGLDLANIRWAKKK
ncbi:ABC transporter substrate-binding protein [Streptomyces sp. KLMMK]|uniref:ABC transporter substrate-binding protein n=1 Tax=Streptomyces sp. KLMMK TaxID=3109353 RepID=UPI003008395F